MSELLPYTKKTSLLKTKYYTDDPANPYETIIIYGHFRYYVKGGRTEFLWFSIDGRRGSKIVFRENSKNVLGKTFDTAMIQYCRILRNRAQECDPIGLAVRNLDLSMIDTVKEASM
jgi:hypothetical protein